MEKVWYIEDVGRELPRMLPRIAEGTTGVFAVVDANVAERFAPQLEESGVVWVPFEAREERKSLETVARIVEWLLEHEADRGALLLGIGGGVTTDITAFAASVYKRGIRYALVPTTLLSQVDAAVGGKTGVNFHGYKNVVGTFGTPEAVLVAPSVLETLPAREWRSGMAEVLKTLIIGDGEMYGKAVEWYVGWIACGQCVKENEAVSRTGMRVAPKPDAETEGIIRRCIEIKSTIVEADRRERGERMKLNLGHTLGHAVESVCMACGTCGDAGRSTEWGGGMEALSHGEAVAAGIIAAAEISVRKGVLAEDTAAAIVRDFKSLGYKDIAEIAAAHAGLGGDAVAAKLSDFVLNDKKRKEDFINFVLIRGLGSVETAALSVNELQEIIYDMY